jgi:hypothetical protein
VLKTRDLANEQGKHMQWATRRSIRVNRLATAWLIRRFIDPQAVFVFVEPDQVADIQQREGMIGFDAPGATYPHKDDKGRCSFEALAEEHCPEDVVLQEIARIVRGADFAEEISLTAESAGVRAISQGFPLVTQDDYETVAKGAFLYDSLYAALQRKLTRRYENPSVDSSHHAILTPRFYWGECC